MLIIQGLTGVTQKQDIQIQNSASRLIIVKTGTTAPIATEIISYGTKGTAKQTMGANRQNLRALALCSQFGEGYMLQEVVADSKIKSAFGVNLNRGVGLAMVGQEYLSVNLENLQSTATYDIYAFESLVDGRELYKYENETIASSASPVSKKYILGSNSVLLAIANNGALNKITLSTNAGKLVEYVPEELAYMARQLNGTTYGPDQLVEDDDDAIVNQVVGGSSKEFFFIPTESFNGFELHTNTGVELQFIVVTNYGF